MSSTRAGQPLPVQWAPRVPFLRRVFAFVTLRSQQMPRITRKKKTSHNILQPHFHLVSWLHSFLKHGAKDWFLADGGILLQFALAKERRCPSHQHFSTPFTYSIYIYIYISYYIVIYIIYIYIIFIMPLPLDLPSYQLMWRQTHCRVAMVHRRARRIPWFSLHHLDLWIYTTALQVMPQLRWHDAMELRTGDRVHNMYLL